jgi:hypothetical protein
MNKIENGLKKLERRKALTKKVFYYNIGSVFPIKTKDRELYFLDEAHLNDVGQEIVGKFYAYQILMTDFPEIKEKVNKEMNQMISQLAKR